jgi:hypothetical protein
LDEAYVYQGLALAQLKNYADAKKAFGNLKSVPNISPRVLKLWELYADKLGAASPAAAANDTDKTAKTAAHHAGKTHAGKTAKIAANKPR